MTARDEVDRIVEAWRRERPELNVEPLQVLSRVSRLARHLDLARKQAFAASDLESWEFDVLSALRRAGKILVHHNVSLQLGADLPMLELDAVLFEQVLFNLLDNAAKYAPSGTTISVRGVRDGGHVMLQIMDEGSGIPPEELESVFDKFYRAQKGDHVRPGTGLGLAISRGFIEAMHGTISAANRPDRRGAIITIRLPVPAASHALDTAA
ncbi:MAG: hypothetical protein K2X36_03670 [Microbacteriaceae bacterium]|nr:hypothetical protein [Microbacteriaceae bacterium]